MKLYTKIRRKLGIPVRYPSETSKVRHLVIGYCTGYGCDLGFGGDKIKKDNCVGIDYANPYTKTGEDKVDIACDLMNEQIPVKDGTFDYVYSSHLIEDFEDTTFALKEFIRVLKSSGHLILVFPDQLTYEKICKRKAQPLNMCHKHKDMGLNYMLDKLKTFPGISFDILVQSDREIDYNVVLVLKIYKHQ